MKKKTNPVIMQSYSLTMARHKLSAVEMRIMAHILIQLKEEQINQYDNEIINASELLGRYRTIKIHSAEAVVSDNHQHVKKALKSLRSRDIEIKTKNAKGRTGTLITGLITEGWYDDNGSDIHISVSGGLLPQLVKLGQSYTKHGLEFLFQTSSAHAIRWYQIGSHWLNKGVFYIDKDEIRQIFGVENKYKAHKDFLKYVISNPFKEINKKSNINIEIAEKHKKGRNIIGFTFKVKAKPQKAIQEPHSKPKETLSTVISTNDKTPEEQQIIKAQADIYIEQREITDKVHKQNVYKKALSEEWGWSEYVKQQKLEEERKHAIITEEKAEKARKTAALEKKKKAEKELLEYESKFLALSKPIQKIILENLANHLVGFKEQFESDLAKNKRAYTDVMYSATFKKVMKDF